jgi:hypothetical protein
MDTTTTVLLLLSILATFQAAGAVFLAVRSFLKQRNRNISVKLERKDTDSELNELYPKIPALIQEMEEKRAQSVKKSPA